MESLLYIKHKKAEGEGELLRNQKKKVQRVLCIYFEMALSLSFVYNVLIGTTPGLTWESLLLSLGEKNLPPVSHYAWDENQAWKLPMVLCLILNEKRTSQRQRVTQ